MFSGYDLSSDTRTCCIAEPGISIQAFFAEHPQFAKNDFFITGESYAGHYIPAFAARVHHGNKAKEGIHINLKVSPCIKVSLAFLFNLLLYCGA